MLTRRSRFRDRYGRCGDKHCGVIVTTRRASDDGFIVAINESCKSAYGELDCMAFSSGLTSDFYILRHFVQSYISATALAGVPTIMLLSSASRSASVSHRKLLKSALRFQEPPFVQCPSDRAFSGYRTQCCGYNQNRRSHHLPHPTSAANTPSGSAFSGRSAVFSLRGVSEQDGVIAP